MAPGSAVAGAGSGGGGSALCDGDGLYLDRVLVTRIVT